MRFYDVENNVVYKNEIAAVDAKCDQLPCSECPMHKVAHVDNNTGCYVYAEKHPEEMARMFGYVMNPDFTEAQKPDMVNHPPHYTQGGIECIDALTAMITPYEDPNDAALSWQVVKYIWRHPFKAKPLEDLKKAQFYLNRLIGHYEKKEGADGK